MRYRVDTAELWTMAAIADESAEGLREAGTTLAAARSAGIDPWCPYPAAAIAVLAAVEAVEEQLVAAATCAAGLARQLGSAATAYEDVDTLRPR